MQTSDPGYVEYMILDNGTQIVCTQLIDLCVNGDDVDTIMNCTLTNECSMATKTCSNCGGGAVWTMWDVIERLTCTQDKHLQASDVCATP